MESHTTKSSIVIIALLAGSVINPTSIKMTFYQKIGFEEISYTPAELLKKPLIDLVGMCDEQRPMRYTLEVTTG